MKLSFIRFLWFLKPPGTVTTKINQGCWGGEAGSNNDALPQGKAPHPDHGPWPLLPSLL